MGRAIQIRMAPVLRLANIGIQTMQDEADVQMAGIFGRRNPTE